MATARTTPFLVRLTPEQHAKIAATATREDRSMASVIRRAIDRYTDEPEETR